MISPSKGFELESLLILIRDLNECPLGYIDEPGRKDFFEIIWLKNEYPLSSSKMHDVDKKGDWIYLIPPYRVHQIDKEDKNGELIAFKREILDEKDMGFFLDLFKIFNVQGEFSCLSVENEAAAELNNVYRLLADEYEKAVDNLIIVKALLKVFLLKLIEIKEQEFTRHGIQEKRVYEFLILLEDNYLQERDTDFYAGQLSISSKRLNQILKDKLDKTGMQLIHDRIILEAKRLIIHSEKTFKEIAYELEFSDRPYFSRFFKKQTGQTPHEFQKQTQNDLSKKNKHTLA